MVGLSHLTSPRHCLQKGPNVMPHVNMCQNMSCTKKNVRLGIAVLKYPIQLTSDFSFRLETCLYFEPSSLELINHDIIDCGSYFKTAYN